MSLVEHTQVRHIYDFKHSYRWRDHCRGLFQIPLAAAGQTGVERALGLMRAELERDMRLMGRNSIAALDFRQKLSVTYCSPIKLARSATA